MISTNMYMRCTCKVGGIISCGLTVHSWSSPAGLLRVLPNSEEQMLQPWAECRNSERD